MIERFASLFSCTAMVQASDAIITASTLGFNRFNVVVLIWFSVASFCVSVIFHLKFVHYTFSTVGVSEWPPFGKKLPTRLAICSHCLLSICNYHLFSNLVLSAGWLLIVSVLVHCYSFTFK